MYTVKNYYSKLSNENKILMHFSHSFFISLAYFFFQILLNLFYSENEPNQIEWLKNSPQNPLNDLKSFQKKIENKTKNNKNLQQLLLCATQSLFACDTQQSGNAQANGSSPTSLQVLKRSCFSFKYKNQANLSKIKQKHAFF